MFGFHLLLSSNMNSNYSYLGAGLGLIGVVISSLRWLRVAQREHYIAGYTSRFALRWFFDRQRIANPILMALAVLAVLVAVAEPSQLLPSGIGLALVFPATLIAPRGLGYRGSTSPLRFTRRLTILAVLTWLVNAVFLLAGAWLQYGITFGAVALILVPVSIDLCLVVTLPLERRGLSKFVVRAIKKLNKISPRVVGITGSFGKTSTKVYVAHLISGTFSTLASPASFNNRAGLARTVNESLAPGTEVLIAEMGTFKKGEIAELCSWMKPQISAITSIGPVHLERFGTEDNIVMAKSEITVGAEVVVLNIDDYRLAEVARKLSEAGEKKIWKVSGEDIHADVSVRDDDEGNLILYANQKRVGSMPDIDISRTNLAIAVAIALELGVSETTIAEALPTLPVAKNRLNVSTTEKGITVLDDTYNSNPAGARLALRALERRRSSQGRSVVVTPGMIELGSKQFEENSLLAKAVSKIATDIVIVGYTNRRALLEGVENAKAAGLTPNVVLMSNRKQAVSWVRSNLISGDSVLYENDLPDHFL